MAWLVGNLIQGRGFGILADVLLGVVGSFVGGWIFDKTGLGGPVTGLTGTGGWYTFAAALVGAKVLVGVAHLFRRA